MVRSRDVEKKPGYFSARAFTVHIIVMDWVNLGEDV